MKKKALIFLILQIFIVAGMLLKDKSMSLVSYINMSFFVGGTLVFIGLLIYIVSNGFFDIFTISMRKVFTFKRNMEDVESMRPPSQLLDFPTTPFFQMGGSILLGMTIALLIFYLV